MVSADRRDWVEAVIMETKLARKTQAEAGRGRQRQDIGRQRQIQEQMAARRR